VRSARYAYEEQGEFFEKYGRRKKERERSERVESER
jgi:hypothetical protein